MFEQLTRMFCMSKIEDFETNNISKFLDLYNFLTFLENQENEKFKRGT